MPTLIVSCVSVAVAFVPEGLPVALTASLTISANMMRKNKILCKSLKTVETLGAVSVICSDKTGTLTAVSPPTSPLHLYDEQVVLSKTSCQLTVIIRCRTRWLSWTAALALRR